MADISVEADRFGATLTQLFARLENGVDRHVPEAVQESLKTGRKAWKKYARRVLSTSYSRGGWGKARNVVYFKSGHRKGRIKSADWYGTTYKTGPYAKSISYHMTSKSAKAPEGEIGSPSLPGLAHLLEKGHGYFPAAPHVHIAPAADETFEDFTRQVDKAVEEAINDA